MVIQNSIWHRYGYLWITKEGDDRKEEKLDLILQKIDSKNAQEEIKKLDKKYARK